MPRLELTPLDIEGLNRAFEAELKEAGFVFSETGRASCFLVMVEVPELTGSVTFQRDPDGGIVIEQELSDYVAPDTDAA